MNRQLLLASVFAAGVTVAGIGHANALAVTWNPGAMPSPALGTGAPGISGNGGNAFTFTSLAIADYAVINAGTGGAFTETGYLDVTGANMGSMAFTPVGLGNPPVTSVGVPPNSNTSGPYTIYFAFSGSGTQSASGFGSNSTGNFTSLTYQLFGVNGTSTFNASGGTVTESNGANTAVLLGSGSLIPDGPTSNQVAVSISPTPPGGTSSGGSTMQISPSASNVNVTFTPNSALTGFFVSPPSNAALTLVSSFINDPTLVTVSNGGNTLVINGGRGTVSANAVVPEPASLALLGSALAGLGLVGYRRRRR